MPVTILARNLDLAGHARQRLEPVLADQSRVIAGTARNDVDVLDCLEQVDRLRAQRLRQDATLRDPSVEGIGQRDGLIENFLQHEVAVGPLLHRVGADLSLMHLPLCGLPVAIEDPDLVPRNVRKIALLEVDETLRDGQ